MKKNFFLAVILIAMNIICSKAQTIVDPPVLGTVKKSTVIDRTINQGFIKAWNWSSPGQSLDSCMGIHYYHNFAFDSPDYIMNSKIIIPLGLNIIGASNSDLVFNAMSLLLNPCITVDSTQNFHPVENDRSGSVFGFYNKMSNAYTIDSSGTGLRRFVLHHDSPITFPALVLNNIWDGTTLHWEDFDGTMHKYKTIVGTDTIWHWNNNIGVTNDTSAIQNDSTREYDRIKYHPFNGKQYYLTVNLTSLDSMQVENHLNDTVLVIRLKYELMRWDTSGRPNPNNPDILLPMTYNYVKFDSLPNTNFTENREIIPYHTSSSTGIDTSSRGTYRRLTPSPSQPDKFAITGAMLKNLGADKSITLSDSHCFQIKHRQVCSLSVNIEENKFLELDEKILCLQCLYI